MARAGLFLNRDEILTVVPEKDILNTERQSDAERIATPV